MLTGEQKAQFEVIARNPDAPTPRKQKRRLARQIELGIVPEGTQLPPRNDHVRPWADHSEDDRSELVGALQQLPPMQRKVVVLRHWLDLSVEETARELWLPVRMRLVSFSFTGVEPEVMGAGPIPSTEKALKQAGLTIDDIEAFEVNEAFAVQVLAFLEHYGIADDDPRVNPYGGAIAMGHPLASSGVRLMTQLSRQFADREVEKQYVALVWGVVHAGRRIDAPIDEHQSVAAGGRDNATAATRPFLGSSVPAERWFPRPL